MTQFPTSAVATMASPSMAPAMAATPRITTVEWQMLDKKRFYPLSMLSSFTVRCFLYPLTLIRTRLQVQHQTAIYSGTLDAYRQISRTEGYRGLYRGFWISAFQVVSGVCYISTYEMVRHQLEAQGVRDTKVKALVGGSAASLVGQTVIVPFDVISQHIMVLGLSQGRHSHPGLLASPLAIDVEGKSRAQVTRAIIRTIYQRDGLRGFYRGYLAALCNYVPSSASWWTFYSGYQELGTAAVGGVVPHTVVQSAAAVMSGVTTSILTNPLDLVRARVQVQRRTIPDTIRVLWEQEGVHIFKKGLTARMTSSCIYSLAVILGYETVKKAAVLPEYREAVLW